MMNYYENLVVGEIRLSSKAIESLEQNGIFEFQWNEPMAGLYDVCIYRDHQTDDLIVSLQKKAVNHYICGARQEVDFGCKNPIFKPSAPLRPCLSIN